MSEKILDGEIVTKADNSPAVIDAMPPTVALTRTAPTRRAGVPGYGISNGWLHPTDSDHRLASQRSRYRLYAENFTNVAIIGTAVRYYLDLLAGAACQFEPAEKTSSGVEIAEFFENAFLEGMETPHPRVVRRAGMYKMYGFSVQEFILKSREDGRIGIDDIQPRPQKTIERWDIDNLSGRVRGVIQRNPNNGQELYIARQKLLYLVDDSLSDTPEGLGLFRHAVRTAESVKRFEDLEHWGFETDLQGVPKASIPYAYLEAAVEQGAITQAQKQAMIATIENLVANHIRGPKMGIAMDSATYKTVDDKEAPSAQRLWDFELLQANGTSHAAVNDAIKRKTFELARLFGVEHLLIGSDGGGSLALHQSSTKRLHAMVNAALDEVCSAEQRQIVRLLAKANGIPEAMTPKLRFEKVAYRSVEEVTAALANMANAGAPLMPTDPAVGEVRDMIGLSRPEMSDTIMAGVERIIGMGVPLDDPNADDDEGEGGPKGQGRRQGGRGAASGGNSAPRRSGGLQETLAELTAYVEGSRESL